MAGEGSTGCSAAAWPNPCCSDRAAPCWSSARRTCPGPRSRSGSSSIPPTSRDPPDRARRGTGPGAVPPREAGPVARRARRPRSRARGTRAVEEAVRPSRPRRFRGDPLRPGRTRHRDPPGRQGSGLRPDRPGLARRTGFDRRMVGSVAESVIREAPCLTLVVKGPPAVERASRPKTIRSLKGRVARLEPKKRPLPSSRKSREPLHRRIDACVSCVDSPAANRRRSCYTGARPPPP